jgi:uncharacterized protein YbbC (DUF1343 family)
MERLAGENLEGLVLRPACFQPSFDKWAGQICSGFQIHLTDPDTYRPYATSLTLTQAVLTVHPDEFSWNPPPYEYEHHHLPIEIILGCGHLHKQLESGIPVSDLEQSWQPQLQEFRQQCAPFLMYG